MVPLCISAGRYCMLLLITFGRFPLRQSLLRLLGVASVSLGETAEKELATSPSEQQGSVPYLLLLLQELPCPSSALFLHQAKLTFPSVARNGTASCAYSCWGAHLQRGSVPQCLLTLLWHERENTDIT